MTGDDDVGDDDDYKFTMMMIMTMMMMTIMMHDDDENDDDDDDDDTHVEQSHWHVRVHLDPGGGGGVWVLGFLAHLSYCRPFSSVVRRP